MIVVFGSINVDLVARVPRLPHPGETLAGSSFAMRPGGKGGNQALAASRAGARVALLGCVGDDPMAAIALQRLRTASVDLSRVRAVETTTGVALIHVDDAGENCITIVAGANAAARAAQVPDALLAEGSTLLMQLEVPLGEVAALARRGHRRGARVMLNAAPAARLPADLLDVLDVLIVNETEARTLASVDHTADAKTLCRALATPARAAVVTRGANGAVYAHGGRLGEQAAPRIDAVDTVGAGDAFAGALAASVDRGERLDDAVRAGVAAGARACLHPGAQGPDP